MNCIRNARAWGSTGAVLCALLATACVDPVGETGGHPASLGIRPTFAVGSVEGRFNFSVDRVRATVYRSTSEVLADTTIPFPDNANLIQLRLKLRLLAKQERVRVILELFDGSQALFRADSTLEVSEGDNLPLSLRASYVGPGAEITSLFITPRDTVLTLGENASFRVSATDANGVVPGLFYIVWETDDPTIAIDQDGLITAPGTRGNVTLLVRTPNGVTDATTIRFAPPPTELIKVGGDNQSQVVDFTVRNPLRVQVLAADGVGVPGVVVHFLPPPGTGVTAPAVTTDDDGNASIFVRLDTLAGPKPFTARVSDELQVTFNLEARAGAPTAIIRPIGNGQTILVGAERVFGFQVQDRYGNLVQDLTVDWIILSAGGVLRSLVTTTDFLGTTANFYTPTLAGPQLVFAQIRGTNLTITFSATAIP